MYNTTYSASERGVVVDLNSVSHAIFTLEVDGRQEICPYLTKVLSSRLLFSNAITENKFICKRSDRAKDRFEVERNAEIVEVQEETEIRELLRSVWD